MGTGALGGYPGDEAIVVRMERASGKPVILVVHYASCDHNGVDKTEVLHPESAAGARAKEETLREHEKTHEAGNGH
ncbi:hypothetical protein [Sporichthya sp.]|uniref:hypothetical protein n=1 Tax=Sporichthya sp. TaxID=65475 RepID=UPI0017CB0A8C|nr:hypothetical protein [Sporichthya sp.]MBA3743907.1 hypothetical protein [Sporichthya sp.]